jgi:hypothetical protein
VDFGLTLVSNIRVAHPLPRTGPCHGVWLTIERVLHELGTELRYEELLENSPTLKSEHIQADRFYAAAVVAMDESIYQRKKSFSASPQGGGAFAVSTFIRSKEQP